MVGVNSDVRVVYFGTAVKVVIPAMWSPRFRLVVQPRNGSSRGARMAQEM
jgi:hypothetical protein